MTGLIRSLETGTAEDQATLIELVWDFVAPTYGLDWSKKKAGQFGRFIDCGAYIDAVMLMAPEACRYILDKRAWAEHRKDGYRAHVWGPPAVTYEATETWASTPALALAAAILKVKETANG